MTPASAARLLTILQAEERLYLEMRDVLQREREHIAELDARALEEAVRRKAALADEGRLLEESRLEVAVSLARELGLDDERPTLARLCDALPADDAGLSAAHSRLAALVGAVQELLAANAGFAGEAQTQVRATLQLLGRLLPDVPTYAATGPVDAPVRTGRLVRQSV